MPRKMGIGCPAIHSPATYRIQQPKWFIRLSEQYNQISIALHMNSSLPRQKPKGKLLFRPAHFLSPVQNTIHRKVTTSKITATIRANPTTFPHCKKLVSDFRWTRSITSHVLLKQLVSEIGAAVVRAAKELSRKRPRNFIASYSLRCIVSL